MNISKIEEGTAFNPQFGKRGGILPVIVQEYISNEILMHAWVNEQCFNESLAGGKAVFFSTSRQQRWFKGETSGNTLTLKEVMIDCDQDCIIYKVSLDKNGVCHTFNKNGKPRKSCFYRKYNQEAQKLEFTEK